MNQDAALPEPWGSVRDRVRERGMRWTPQRRAVVEALAATRGHVTGAELVERCRTVDPATIPSTVYRTLAVLEEMGLVRHGHGVDGREEFHVAAEPVHGHLYCDRCGGRWEVSAPEARAILDAFRATNGFEPDLSHMTIVGRCAACAAAGA
jgi:Fur family transcriptional regulator, ferric uptake regulator